MPIYEYACTSCGERTEAKQSFDDPPLETCAQCGGKLRKLYSPVGVVFRGSGFYSTDGRRRQEGDKKEAKSEKANPSSDKGEPSASGSSKDKPA